MDHFEREGNDKQVQHFFFFFAASQTNRNVVLITFAWFLSYTSIAPRCCDIYSSPIFILILHTVVSYYPVNWTRLTLNQGNQTGGRRKRLEHWPMAGKKKEACSEHVQCITIGMKEERKKKEINVSWLKEQRHKNEVLGSDKKGTG